MERQKKDQVRAIEGNKCFVKISQNGAADCFFKDDNENDNSLLLMMCI